MDFEIGVEPVGFTPRAVLRVRGGRLPFFRFFSAVSASAITPSSFSASPSSIMPTLSSSSRSTLPMPESESSSEVRSCINFCAFWGSFQRFGSSASLFSSARRAVDASTSKMPPQQPDRLLDLFDESFDFSAHGFSDLRHKPQLKRM